MKKSYFLKPQDIKCCASSTIASKDISKTTGWILSKIGRNDPHMALFKFFQMGTFHCISRSHRLKIDFPDNNFKIYSCLKLQGLEL